MKIGAAWCALSLFAAAARAQATDDDQAMGRRVQELLRAHQQDVFGCVQELHGTPDGELLLLVSVGADQHPSLAKVLKHQVGDKAGELHGAEVGNALSKCLVDKALRWDLSSLQAASGDSIVFPLVFRPEQPVYVVHPPPVSAAVATKIQARAILSGSGTPAHASLSWVELAASVRQAVHTHPVGEAIYVLRGLVRVRQPGLPPVNLKAGEAVWFKPDEPHALEAAPLAPAVLLQVFAPAGPERAYADPKAPGTTASHVKKVATAAFIAHDVKPLSILRAKGAVKLLFDGSELPIAVDELSADAGAHVPPHKHDSDELLYITAGRAITTVGGERFFVAPGDGVRIPAGIEHSLDVEQKLTAVQVYAPAGPEQRFKSSPPLPRGP